MAREVEEKEIVKIINLVDEYEIFLKEVNILINKYSPIESIDWIMKKDANIL